MRQFKHGEIARPAGFRDQQIGQLLDVRHDRIGHLLQHRFALAKAAVAPGRKGGPGGGHCGIDIVGSRVGHLVESLASAGIDDIHRARSGG